MDIRRYNKDDEKALMSIIEAEGEEWSCYSAPEFAAKYKSSLSNSITFVAYQNGELCGYSRSVKDGEFYIYVCDLLVPPRFRGQSIGRQLMECIYTEYPSHTVYVMSDVDEYYTKQGYIKEGSVFEVTNNT